MKAVTQLSAPLCAGFVYHYITVDPNDDLCVLLANKRKRAAEQFIMKMNVQSSMTQIMDTGVRVNPVLVRMHGRESTSSSSITPTMSVPSDSDFESHFALSDEYAIARNLVLVAVVFVPHE